jgi:hypothetical protein
MVKIEGFEFFFIADKTNMSLTGILLDVSRSMRVNIGSGIDGKGGPWAQSIFNVIVDLIEHDLTSENRVFAIGVGAECPSKEIFDVIATVQKIEKMPCATKHHIYEIFNILERNGARYIRKWASDISLIETTITDYTARLVLRKLKSDDQFLRKFVDEFLPFGCRDNVPTTVSLHDVMLEPDLRNCSKFLLTPLLMSLTLAENATTSTVGSYRPATKEDIYEVVKKAKSYLLKDIQQDASYFLEEVGTHSIFSVQDASRIIRKCVGEKELKERYSKRKQELLENVEPFIYGGTPLYASLEKAIELFEGDTSENKLLFVLSDGKPTDGNDEDIAKVKQITSKLKDVGVKMVSCFITASTNIDPKRLYDEIPPPPREPGAKCWEPGAQFLFSLSSEIRTRDLVARAVLVKRGWKIDIAKNETKLFMQVNHPDNIRYIKIIKFNSYQFLLGNHRSAIVHGNVVKYELVGGGVYGPTPEPFGG